MPLTKDDILKVASLARLELTTEELEQLYKDLAQIVVYVDQIKQVNTEGIIPQTQFIKIENVFRNDINRPSLPREKVLGNVPDQDGEYIRVPKVLG
ncbi:MAG: Asp-tRNA(Asn)/Glu-tRNA(Gln) amidotransferase subunit GatC [candidate division Zixibacteria bacterium]|nr:Asp-tRNA(Asn)/Glu-tRNA(Gln) amidotransferase subunit GatC [candidate division Zixibacteria bacterium]